MADPLHHSTLAAITRLAQARGLPIVRADSECVILDGAARAEKLSDGGWAAICSAPGGGRFLLRGFRLRRFASATLALRAALREVR